MEGAPTTTSWNRAITVYPNSQKPGRGVNAPYFVDIPLVRTPPGRKSYSRSKISNLPLQSWEIPRYICFARKAIYKWKIPVGVDNEKKVPTTTSRSNRNYRLSRVSYSDTSSFSPARSLLKIIPLLQSVVTDMNIRPLPELEKESILYKSGPRRLNDFLLFPLFQYRQRFHWIRSTNT